MTTAMLKLDEHLSRKHPGVAHLFRPVARDHIAALLEKMLHKQNEFRLANKPYRIDLGYHYTNDENMIKIQENGLLTRLEQQDAGVAASRLSGEAYGPGIYTGNDPYTHLGGYGNAGLLLLRLRGVEHSGPVGRCRGASDGNEHDSVVDTPFPTTSIVVLKSSSQCVALIHYDSNTLKRFSDQREKCPIGKALAEYHLCFKYIIDEMFNSDCPAEPRARPEDFSSTYRIGPFPSVGAAVHASHAAAATYRLSDKAKKALAKHLDASRKRKEQMRGLALAKHLDASRKWKEQMRGPVQAAAQPTLAGGNPSSSTSASSLSTAHAQRLEASRKRAAQIKRQVEARHTRRRLNIISQIPAGIVQIQKQAGTHFSPLDPASASPSLATATTANTAIPSPGAPAGQSSGQDTTIAGPAGRVRVVFLSQNNRASSATGALAASADSASTGVAAPTGGASSPSSTGAVSNSPRRRVHRASGLLAAATTGECISYAMPTSVSDTHALPKEAYTLFKPTDKSECTICYSRLCDPDPEGGLGCGRLACQHEFHIGCLIQAAKRKAQCPMCRNPFQQNTPIGQMPSGTMRVATLPHVTCAGYSAGSLVIQYTFPSGVQQEYHPNPGARYHGTTRVAYIPDTDEGRRLVYRLKEAFRHGLTFAIGTSLTTGRCDSITWVSVPHKTSHDSGAHGFPDPQFLQTATLLWMRCMSKTHL